MVVFKEEKSESSKRDNNETKHKNAQDANLNESYSSVGSYKNICKDQGIHKSYQETKDIEQVSTEDKKHNNMIDKQNLVDRNEDQNHDQNITENGNIVGSTKSKYHDLRVIIKDNTGSTEIEKLQINSEHKKTEIDHEIGLETNENSQSIEEDNLKSGKTELSTIRENVLEKEFVINNNDDENEVDKGGGGDTVSENDNKDDDFDLNDDEDEIENDDEDEVENEDEVDNEDEDEIDNEDDDAFQSTAPIDKGWAWVVMFGSFVIFFLMPIYETSLFVLFLDVVDKMETSISQFTVALLVGNFAYAISAQITNNYLAPRFTIRLISTVACVVNGIVLILLSVYPNFVVFIIVHTVKMIVSGISSMPSITLVSMYFKKRRALATSIAIMGWSFTSLLGPPFVRYLSDEYGFSGCYLILAGIELNCIPASMVFRPIESYARIPSNESLTKKIRPNGIDFRSSGSLRGSIRSPISQRHFKYTDSEYKFPVLEQISEISVTPVDKKEPEKASLIDVKEDNQNIVVDSLKTNFIPKLSGSRLFHGSQSTIQDDSSHIHGSRFFGSQSTIQDFIKPNLPRSVGLQGSRSTLPHISQWSLVTSSFIGSTANLNIKPQLMSSVHNISQDSRIEISEKQSCFALLKSIFTKILDPRVTKNPLALYFAFIYTFGSGHLIMKTYITSLGISQGVDKETAALLLTVIGVTETASKFIFGLITDWNIVKAHHNAAFAGLALGIVCQFVAFYDSIGTLMFLAAVSGLMGAVGLGLNAMMIIEMIGLDLLGQVLGLCSFVSISLWALQQPIIGTLIETTGGFKIAFYYTGVGYIVYFTGLMCLPLVRKWHDKRTNK